uniref:SAM domain-containing protein n=1 Tax=Knipowitschia caucasica TaxID=637954 RepID=A0AAV2LEP8_KNICA
MSNRSIAWWLRQIELPQYIRCLEGEYYGLEVSDYVLEYDLEVSVYDLEVRDFGLGVRDNGLEVSDHGPEPCQQKLHVSRSSQGLINVTNEELRAAGVEEEAHRQTIIQQLKRHRLRLEPHSGPDSGLSYI